MAKEKNRDFKDIVLVGTISLAIGVFGTLGVGSIVGSSKGEEVPKGVVATYDGKEITAKELYEEMLPMYGSQMIDNIAADRFTELEVKAKKIKIPDEKIDEEFKVVKEQYGSEDEFKEVLKSIGQTEEELRADMLAYLQMVELLKEYIDTSDETLKADFEANKSTYDQQEQVDADHILVDDEALAKEIHGKILAGESFEELAKEHSTDYNPDQENGANLGTFPRNTMVEEFEDVVFAMKKGEISAPFKTEFGWHIARVNDRIEFKEAKFEEVKDKVEEKVVGEGLEQAYTSWMEEMKEKYKYENKVK